MKRIFGLLAVVTCILVLGACSLIGSGSTTTPSGIATSYPDGVAYKIKLPNETYLCSSFTSSTNDAEISLRLNDVYLLSSDGKVTWVGKEKVISAVAIEKVLK